MNRPKRPRPKPVPPLSHTAQGHPRPLRPGARIAVTCPASPPDPGKLERGIVRLRDLGFDVVIGTTCRAPEKALHAGDDTTRAAELLSFIRDPSIEAIFAGRGGVGCMRLLPHMGDLLDPPPDPAKAGARARIPPKWIVGRSDLTALHLTLYGSLGWIGVSGPMVATDLGAESPPPDVMRRTLRLLTDSTPLGRIETAIPPEAWPSPGAHRPGDLSPGTGLSSEAATAEGPLFPVNLSLLSSLLGTPYLPSLEGAIVVLEEIDEPPHRIDRMLTQLRLSGVLEGIAGFVFGQFTACLPRDSAMPEDLLVRLLQDHSAAIDTAQRAGSGAPLPVIAGFPYGHEPDFQPLPVGVRARIQSDPERPAELWLIEGAAGAPDGATDHAI